MVAAPERLDPLPWNNHGVGTRKGTRPGPGLEGPPGRSRDWYKQMMPRGPGIPGPVVFVLAGVLAAVVAFFAFTFRVHPDELGVVMRFGKVTRQEPPGLHFRMPYPIDEVRLPKVTRQNIVEVGMRTGTGTAGLAGAVSYVREESLMLTGDENIVDVNVVVYWRIHDALKYLFSMQSPEVSVKDVAESAMREVVGQSDIQPILTGARQKTEQTVQELMQSVLDHYGAGIRIDRVQLQKIDPPTQVIEAFRDVQAAAADKEKLQNEAFAYASRVVPEARGDAERILQGALGFQQQTVAEATGQTARFVKVFTEYQKAPDVTRTRLYLETMERVFGSADKILIDSSAVVPFLSVGARQERKGRGK
jgi:membrane protease subunit HflK